MRGFLTYLMLILFVGSHWLADLTPHFHEEQANRATISAVESASNIGSIADVNTAVIDAQSYALADDCCARADLFDVVDDIHCMADIGLVVTGSTSYSPRPCIRLLSPKDLPIFSQNMSDLFRPPIV